MGNTYTSRHRVEVKLSLHVDSFRLDTITLSCCQATCCCCGHVRRRIGHMTFPKEGWVRNGDTLQCIAQHGLSLPLERLRQQDGDTAVTVKCSHEGELLHVATMSLGHLLAMVERAVEEGVALSLSLASGGDGVTELLCNLQTQQSPHDKSNGTVPESAPPEPSSNGQSEVAQTEDFSVSSTLKDSHVHNASTFLTQEGTQEDEAEQWVHKAIHLAPRFRSRLAGPDECFLEYLRNHYSVLIYLENSRKKLHVKGPKHNAEECNLIVRELLAKWRQEETTQQTNTTTTTTAK